MDSRNQREGSYPELFPEDFGQRLERFTELLGVALDRVMEWRNGTIPTGGEVWHIMRLAWSVPGGVEVMLTEATEDYRKAE